MTLSPFFGYYLYIPLRGNRRGPALRYMNLMITMLLGGLWHGASWTFVVWGALHGVYLCAERLIKRFRDTQKPVADEVTIQRASLLPVFTQNKSANNFLLALFTFYLVNVTWVFFR